MLKVVIIGYGEMFTNLIAAALDAECEIVGILRRETVKYSKFKKKLRDIINPSLEYSYIKSYNLPEIEDVKSVNDELFRKKLLKLNPDILLVGSWGERIEKKTFDIPKIASINAHPSLLPKYRGPNPYYWVIKNREHESGITFHLIDSGYDTGAILAQEVVKIYPSDNGESLKKRTVLTARGVAYELLTALKEDIIIPLSQNEEKASYYSYPDNLELDFTQNSEDVLASIKAIYPWDRTYFYHKNTVLTPNPNSTYIENNTTTYSTPGTIVEVNADTETISVLCQEGKIIKMQNVKLFKGIDKPFSKNYIKLEIKEGDLII